MSKQETTTTIRFWGGLKSIGGNIAEVRHGRDRVIFDFGYVFYRSVYGLLDESDREGKRVVDLLRLGAILPIEGLYRRTDLIEGTACETLPQCAEDSEWNTAVLISHLHLDHMGAVDTIAPHIPVYVSEETLALYDVLRAVGEEKRIHSFSACAYGVPVNVGGITVTPYRTDHDVFGASSFLIETPDMTLMFSGDLYMHGDHREWNEEWIEHVRKKGVDVLLMEGTSFRPSAEKSSGKASPPLRESDVATVAAEWLRACEGLAFMNVYHRNVGRIRYFVRAAQLCGRTAVLEPETAYVASQLLGDLSFSVYVPHASKEQPAWQQELYERYDTVSAGEINENARGYLLQNSFHNRYDMLDLPLQNSLYIHANGIPFGSFAFNYEILVDFLQHLGVQYRALHVSGHATEEDALKIIQQIRPKVVVPWHTMYPQLMRTEDPATRVCLPDYEQTYQLVEGDLRATESQ